MPVKEIIIFNRNVQAGVSTVLKNIIQFSPNSNIKFKLILYNNRGKSQNEINENWCDDVVRLELDPLNNLYYELKKIKKHINNNSIIVANDLLELRLVGLLKLSNPLIYIVHGDFNAYYENCIQYQGYIDTFIVISIQIDKKLKTLLKPENINKVKLLYFPSKNIEPDIKKSNNLNILFVGSLISRKGIELFPEIFKVIDDHKINYTFRIVGNGEKFDLLKESFTNNKNVFLLGHLPNEEVIEIMKESDILLFPSRSEGFPNVLIESMKAGCVPVVSNIPSGIPDIIENMKNGIIVEIDDYQGFANALISLATNKTLRNKMAEAAIIKANKMFDPVKNASLYIDAFLNVEKRKNNVTTKLHKGKLLNQNWIPNILVKWIRSMKISNKL